jgi:hypothetical protein
MPPNSYVVAGARGALYRICCKTGEATPLARGICRDCAKAKPEDEFADDDLTVCKPCGKRRGRNIGKHMYDRFVTLVIPPGTSHERYKELKAAHLREKVRQREKYRRRKAKKAAAAGSAS